MDKETLQTKRIVRNNLSYLQYDLPIHQAKTSFFDISPLPLVEKMHPEAMQEMHCHNFIAFLVLFWRRDSYRRF